MRYFHCPRTYRAKPYGCGFGPCNATQAFIDYGKACPRCAKELRPYKAPRLAPVGYECIVRGCDGQRYCNERPTQGPYCARHAYLNHSHKED